MDRRRWLILLFAIILTLFILKAFAFTAVDLKESSFSYRPEADTYALLEKLGKRPQPQSGGLFAADQVDTITRVYQDPAATDVDLKHWTAKGGASPRQFRIRLKLRNYGNEASRPQSLKIIVSAKVGEYYVNPQSFLVDYDHLKKTAQWQEIQQMTDQIPVLAPNQTLNYFSETIPFGDYVNAMPNHHPFSVKAAIYLNQAKTPKVIEIPVTPHHFALKQLSD